MSKKVFRNIAFFVAVFSATFAWSAEVTAPAGAVRNLTANDFMPHQNSAKEFNETWSYQFVFDNGTRAFVNYSTLYVPASGKKVGCDLTFWNFKPGKGHRVYFTADKNGKFFLDLTFESAEQGKVPGDGIWKIGNEKFAQYIHIPYGRVSGRIGYNEDTISVKGYAYMDQTWQTVQAIDIAGRSINFSTNTRSPLYAGRISLTPKGTPFGYALYNGNEGMKVAMPSQIKEGTDTYSGKKFPKTELTIEWKDGTPALKFPVNKTYQKASLLDKVDGWFAKKAMKIAAGGEVLFYRGRSDGNNGKKIDWAVTGVKD